MPEVNFSAETPTVILVPVPGGQGPAGPGGSGGGGGGIEWEATDYDYISWTYSPMLIGSTPNPVLNNGILFLSGMKIPEATTITNLHFFVVGALDMPIEGQNFATLYQDGNLLGVTEDQGANWQTTGLKTMPLTTPQDVEAGLIYFGFWCNTDPDAGTLISPAMPLLNGQNVMGAADMLIGPNTHRFCADISHVGLTDTAPETLGTLYNIGNYWAAVS